MSQSLANIVVHLVFSTKHRRQLLRDEERGQLHAYMTGILKNYDSPLIEINFAGLKARNVIAWAGASPTSAGPGQPFPQISPAL
jgi:hypothetical protein